MTDMGKSYDYVIIGSGAGGATLAQKLLAGQKSILMLERGNVLPVEEENWDPKEVFIKHRYKAHDQWYDRKGKKFTPNIHYWVGGNTIFYGAALYRFRKNDFEETEHFGGALSPAWPISYEDLAPYYDQAERLWGVHGTRGEDPTDDPAAPPYPKPALIDGPDIAHLKKLLRAVGVTPFSMPMAVERDDQNPDGSRCIRCRTCGGFPCKNLAKGDGRKMVALAEQFDHFTLLSGAKVTRLETNVAGNEITQIRFTHDGEEKTVCGDVVVLAAGAVNSAALLLASHNSAHPNGLANGSDQVGRNYMFHNASASLSFGLPKIRTNFLKTMAINDYYWSDPDGGFDYPMGHIQMLEYLSGDVIRGQIGNSLPSWLVPNFIANAIGERLIPFLLMTEDLPEQRNRVRLRDDGSIQLDYWPNNLVAHKRLMDRFHGIMDQAGRKCICLEGHRAELDAIIPLYGTAHQCGTLRMGQDPQSSVVDVNCRAHEIANLYVADTSVFVTSAAVNPALTAIANSLRIGDVLLNL